MASVNSHKSSRNCMAAFALVLFTCRLLCTFAVYKLAALQCVAIATSLLTSACILTGMVLLTLSGGLASFLVVVRPKML